MAHNALMAWLNTTQLEAKYQNTQFLEQLKTLYTIREFFVNALKPSGFAVPEEFTCVVPTTAGQKIMEQLESRESTKFEQWEASYVLFLLFYHQDLLIDVEQTDPSGLKRALGRLTQERAITFPWIFDHLLYDRAFELFPDRPDRLSKGQSEQLLRDTPIGVFQVGKLVCGPGGIFESEQSRFMPPTRELLLWHCPDITCNAAHGSRLSQGETKYSQLISGIQSALNRSSLPSDWRDFVTGELIPYKWTDDFFLVNLPVLLGSGFSQSELRTLLKEVFDVGGKNLRRVIFGIRPELVTKGGSEQAIDSLTKAEVLQVLLLASDVDLVSAMDNAVTSGRIYVPPSEIRKAIGVVLRRSWTRCFCELSDLGLRVVGGDVPRTLADPMARLKRLILEVYGADADERVLQFYLRGISGSAVGQQLELYLRSKDPADSIRKFLFASPERLKAAFNNIRAPHFRIPDNEADDTMLINQLLWKLGFKKVRVESRLTEFYARLEEFRGTAQTADIDEEEGRKLIRSAGINLFVSLEEILDLALSFTTWLLLADHISQELIFNLQRGRTLAASELSGILEIEGQPVKLDDSGRNTLFPLIVGFKALINKTSAVVRESSRFLKDPVFLAHYSGSTTLQVFPYRHSHFACDLAPADLERTLTLIENVSTSLQKGPVMLVRNRIDHKTETFPSKQEFQRCCEMLEIQVNNLEDAGLIPIVQVTKSIVADRFNRQRVISVDYAGREFVWFVSPSIHAIRPLPRLDEPQLLVKSLFIPGTGEPARYRMQEVSEFTEIWKDYPKRSAPSNADRLLAINAPEDM
jgi:hypothetical protein